MNPLHSHSCISTVQNLRLKATISELNLETYSNSIKVSMGLFKALIDPWALRWLQQTPNAFPIDSISCNSSPPLSQISSPSVVFLLVPCFISLLKGTSQCGDAISSDDSALLRIRRWVLKVFPAESKPRRKDGEQSHKAFNANNKLDMRRKGREQPQWGTADFGNFLITSIQSLPLCISVLSF